MVDTADIHNKIAEEFDLDYANLYHQCRQIAIAQCVDALPTHIDSVLDFCLGTGNAFQALHESSIEADRYIGNDIAQAMLDVTRQKLTFPIETICGDVRDLESKIPPSSQDLIFSHFIFAYTDIATVLAIGARLLKPTGLLSVMTTTKQNLLELYQEHFKPLQRVVPVERLVKKSPIPDDHAHFLKHIEAAGLSVVAEARYTKPVTFQTPDDLWAWGFKSGWVVSWFEQSYQMKTLAVKYGLRALNKLFRLFPCSGTSDISIVLLRQQ